MSIFDRYLSIWVALCIAGGVALGKWLPVVPETLGRWEYAHVSLPVAVLIALMIYPMMLKIDFRSIRDVGKQPRGIVITCTVNWLLKPFMMYVIAWCFFYGIFRAWMTPAQAEEYLAGAVLLGAAPCTAMVFVWSQLTRGDAAYTLVQVAVNDLIILIAFAPIVALLLGVSGVSVPWMTLMLSVGIFIVIPLMAAIITRAWISRQRGVDWFREKLVPRLAPITPVGLLLTLVILFSFQGHTIIENPLHILLIATPLTVQTALIFLLAYSWAWKWELPHRIAAPAALIGASNFFELAVAVAISLFGLRSGAALATVVGVLVEVPIMLALVRLANSTRKLFKK